MRHNNTVFRQIRNNLWRLERTYLSFEELRQVGISAALEAETTHNQTKLGLPQWVRLNVQNAIHREIDYHSPISHKCWNNIAHIRRVTQELEDTLHCRPTEEQILEESDLSAVQLRNVRRAEALLAADAVERCNEARCLPDDDPNPEAAVIHDEEISLVWRAMDELESRGAISHRHADLMRCRWQKEMGMEQAALNVGITRQAARTAEVNCIVRIKTHMARRGWL